jgi:hypothetical protein
LNGGLIQSSLLLLIWLMTDAAVGPMSTGRNEQLFDFVFVYNASCKSLAGAWFGAAVED